MSAMLTILRAGPLTSVQDAGRFGMLRHGIGASGPMDGGAFALAGALAGGGCGSVEFTMAGLEIGVASGRCRVGFAGGDFVVKHNGVVLDWPGTAMLRAGDTLAVTPGTWGNYGYLRFDADIDLPPVMGSMATSSRAQLGGLDGRVLRAGDAVALRGGGESATLATLPSAEPASGPIRVIWGLHADLFPQALRQRFLAAEFVISSRLDRMGVRLEDAAGVFAEPVALSLVSDAIVPGDIQILGDGTPIVLMRDHQPTGGYPRIATVISADLDRFAQLRHGTPVAFEPVTVEHAHALLRSR
ncbi:biotin-dependent carboxyltransferase family protein [Devosia ginsengisoli]|uniref:5-oxoprolinase subunit C family protein n=1 Tax=Devosia ginsengisoli TaxID=400770 RepID=UPI0026F13185|nr:biotin-dependent carboxyltransferase family protein [Devosia ginsengisoli]MCR6672764.1 biotin-dependent carboxyltransferase family protein [Devosia ginsengisoli]